MMETGFRGPSPTGWRKATPGLCRASALAADGEGEEVTRNRAMLALRRVAPAIGLKPGDVLLLDTLAVFTRPCDWEAGSRPIVWPSNDYLMEATGLSLSAVKRRLRRLAEAGVIAYKDSSNGKRWGRRDEDGRIREAYGFDLAPLAARAPEFEALHASIQAERDLRKALRRQITILRRSVRAMLDEAAAGGRAQEPFWQGVAAGYGALMARLEGAATTNDALCDVHEAFTALRQEGEEALRAEAACHKSPSDCPEIENSNNTNPSGAARDPHIPITNHRQSVKGNGLEEACTWPERRQEPQTREPVATGRQEEATVWPQSAARAGEGEEDTKSPTGKTTGAGHGEAGLTLRTLLFACPAFAETAHGLGSYIRNWRELVAAAETIRPMVGISGDAWQGARTALGERRAAAALALIADKVAEGSIASPGGYLRGLTEKAARGELHLARSVYGRLSERRREGA